MLKIFKETSFIAVFSLLLVVFGWMSVVFGIPNSARWIMPDYICGAGAVLGVISLIYIKKKRLKGRWLAISAIALGILGAIILVSL